MEIEMYLGERAQTYKLKPNNFQACWKVLKEKQLKITERLQCKGNEKTNFMSDRNLSVCRLETTISFLWLLVSETLIKSFVKMVFWLENQQKQLLSLTKKSKARSHILSQIKILS